MTAWRVRVELDPMTFDVKVLIGHDPGRSGEITKLVTNLSENGMEFMDIEPHTLTVTPRLTLPDDLAHSLMLELVSVLRYSSAREVQLTRELVIEKERTTLLMGIVHNLTGRKDNE